MYHIERYVEVIARVALTYDPNITGPISVDDWYNRAGERYIQVQSAVATELAEFIQDGQFEGGLH
jgi:hypothetical protein